MQGPAGPGANLARQPPDERDPLRGRGAK